MFREIGDEEITVVATLIDKLKIFKTLHEKGYKFSHVELLTDYDELQIFQDELGGFILKVMFGDYYTSKLITEEPEEDVKNKLPYDVDEYAIYEICIKHPSILAYYDYCIKYNKCKDIDGKFYTMVRKVIPERYCWYCDYTHYEAYVPDNLDKGIVLLVSDYIFLDYEFVTKMLDLIKFCEEKVKEGELNDTSK